MGAIWTVLLQTQAGTPLSGPDMETAYRMYVIGIVAVGVAWTVVPLAFVFRGETKILVEVLKQGTALRYITVTYIVLIAVTLALVGRLEGEQVSTLLAAIAGYVLGQSGRQREPSETSDDAESEKKKRLREHDDVRPSTAREAG